MNTSLVIKLTVVLAALLGCLLAIAPSSWGAKVSTAQFVMLGVLHIGAAILFFLGLRGFTQKFKRAYRFISIGILLYALGMLEYSILNAFNLFDSWLATSGLLAIPFVLYLIFFYIGTKDVARVLGLRGLLTRWYVVAGGTILFTAACAFIPLPGSLFKPEDVSGIMAMTGLAAALIAVPAVLLYKLYHQVGPIYQSAFRWSFFAFSIILISSTLDTFTQAYIPADHWYKTFSLSTTPYFLSVFCFIKSAWEFDRVPIALQELAKTKASTDGPARGSAVDIVIFAAQLASNVRMVDPILDKVRRITAQPGKVTVSDQKELAEVFLKLEDYLTNQDPTRTLSKNDLRAMIELRFAGTATDPLFWSAIRS